MTYLAEPFVLNALLATFTVAVTCGLIGPFVVMRGMAFAVHGTSELAFTGAAAGLLIGGSPVAGAFAGALVVAVLIGTLGNKSRERDSAIGTLLAFGLGLGVLLLSFYQGFATQATNILFGNIFGVSGVQLLLLVGVGIFAMLATLFMYRPLLFATVDPEVAEAKGVPLKRLNLAFVAILALTVTAAAQVVGTLLVLSLAITPAAAAIRLHSQPGRVVATSLMFACLAGVGGVLLGLWFPDIKPSVFIATLSFVIYLIVRIVGRK